MNKAAVAQWHEEKNPVPSVISPWPQKARQEELVDISPNGMRFRSIQKLRAKSVTKISCSYLRGIAEVRNTHKIFADGKTIYSIGVHFISVTFSEQKGSFYSARV